MEAATYVAYTISDELYVLDAERSFNDVQWMEYHTHTHHTYTHTPYAHNIYTYKHTHT